MIFFFVLGSGLPLLGQFLPQTKNSLLSSSKLNSSYSGKFFDLNKNIIANDDSMDCLCVCYHLALIKFITTEKQNSKY